MEGPYAQRLLNGDGFTRAIKWGRTTARFSSGRAADKHVQQSKAYASEKRSRGEKDSNCFPAKAGGTPMTGHSQGNKFHSSNTVNESNSINANMNTVQTFAVLEVPVGQHVYLLLGDGLGAPDEDEQRIRDHGHRHGQQDHGDDLHQVLGRLVRLLDVVPRKAQQRGGNGPDRHLRRGRIAFALGFRVYPRVSKGTTHRHLTAANAGVVLGL